MARPYLRLMRVDRPVGTWLLLLPCWWGLVLAAKATDLAWQTGLGYGLLFGVGAFVMRGAGCVYNDIVDRDIDRQVARTASRPLPSGQVTPRQAWLFLGGLCVIGLIVLLQFNRAAIFTGLAALGLVAAYPFMKRITWWPQVWLGLTFNWGVLVGFVAVTGRLEWSAGALYAAGICWTIGYDTIYAHQDKEDDQLIGVRSTALKFGTNTKRWLYLWYGLTLTLVCLAGWLSGLWLPFYAAMMLPGLHFIWQLRRLAIDDPDICLRIFKSNREAGALILTALVLGLV